MRYPKEAVVFEITSLRASGVFSLQIGQHVEGAGPCCIDTERAWLCGVLMLNGQKYEEDEMMWASHLRPLTQAARDMLALVSK